MSLLDLLDVPAASARFSSSSTLWPAAAAACATPTPWMPPPTTTTSKRRIAALAAARGEIAKRLDHRCDGHGLDEVRAALRERERELRRIDLVDRPTPRTAPQARRVGQFLVIAEQEFGLEGFVLEACVTVVFAQHPADRLAVALARH